MIFKTFKSEWKNVISAKHQTRFLLYSHDRTLEIVFSKKLKSFSVVFVLYFFYSHHAANNYKLSL